MIIETIRIREEEIVLMVLMLAEKMVMALLLLLLLLFALYGMISVGDYYISVVTVF